MLSSMPTYISIKVVLLLIINVFLLIFLNFVDELMLVNAVMTRPNEDQEAGVGRNDRDQYQGMQKRSIQFSSAPVKNKYGYLSDRILFE